MERKHKNEVAISKVVYALENGISLREACRSAKISTRRFNQCRKLDVELDVLVSALLAVSKENEKALKRDKKKDRAEAKRKVPAVAAEVIPDYGKRYACWRCGWSFTCRTFGKTIKCPICQSKFWYLKGKHENQSTAKIRTQYKKSPRFYKSKQCEAKNLEG